MRAVVQRVSRASVTVAGQEVGAIGTGLLVLLGVAQGDSDAEADWMARKVIGLRVFADEAGKMNRSIADVAGGVLAVSQFTLCGDARKGNRPSFAGAMEPSEAERLYRRFCDSCRQSGTSVAEGVFRAHMEVALVNDGPVTILIETPGQS